MNSGSLNLGNEQCKILKLGTDKGGRCGLFFGVDFLFFLPILTPYLKIKKLLQCSIRPMYVLSACCELRDPQ